MPPDTLPQLQRAFDDFRADPGEMVRVAARRFRAAQIRSLLTDPLRIDVAAFNRDIWPLESAAALDGHDVRGKLFGADRLSNAEVHAFRDAIANGSLEIHGNLLWRPGSETFHPTEPDPGKRMATLRAAAQALNAAEMSPAEKARHLESLPGFGQSLATGLVMIFHPDAFALRHEESVDNVMRLGYAADTAASFQAAVQDLKSLLGAADFLELDWFLCQAKRQGVFALPPPQPSPEPTPPRRIVKIAPGDHARFWPECLAGGFICVGWDDTGDLNDYPDKAALSDAFDRLYDYNRSKRAAKVNELWTLRVLLPGDIVVANRGTREVLAVGRVTEPGYVFQPARAEFKHTVTVAWDTSVAGAVPKQGRWAMQTIAPVPQDFYRFLCEGGPLPSEGVSHTAEEGGDYECTEASGPPVGYRAPSFATLQSALRRKKLRITDRDLRRYHLSLKTRGFVVLSGVSGVGKTWLAEAYADAVAARSLLVAVAPNWTTNEDLLGYYNPLTQKQHDTAFSAFLREAADAYRQARRSGVAPRPYHLILDEMNLARVEHYFARFLSAMEVRARDPEGATIELGPDDLVPLPPNLSVIGTVNMDETTHAFADKVFDRAQLIELGVTRAAMADHLGDAPYARLVLAVWSAVHPVAPFAFRVLDEIDAYVQHARAIGVPWEEALDEQLLQKVLPRLKGADPQVGKALTDFLSAVGDGCPLSRAKADAILAGYRTHGIASYF